MVRDRPKGYRKKTKDSLAVTQRLGESLLTIALGLLATLDGHVESPKVVLELEVDRPLRCWKVDFLYFLFPRNFVDLSYIL